MKTSCSDKLHRAMVDKVVELRGKLLTATEDKSWIDCVMLEAQIDIIQDFVVFEIDKCEARRGSETERSGICLKCNNIIKEHHNNICRHCGFVDRKQA